MNLSTPHAISKRQRSPKSSLSAIGEVDESYVPPRKSHRKRTLTTKAAALLDSAKRKHAASNTTKRPSKSTQANTGTTVIARRRDGASKPKRKPRRRRRITQSQKRPDTPSAAPSPTSGVLNTSVTLIPLATAGSAAPAAIPTPAASAVLSGPTAAETTSAGLVPVPSAASAAPVAAISPSAVPTGLVPATCTFSGPVPALYTAPVMKKELRAAGVDMSDLTSGMRKLDYAVCVMMVRLTKSQAAKIHAFIHKRVPPKTSRVDGKKPYVSGWYFRLFNPVDRFNRLIYELYHKYPVTNWKFRALLYFGTAAMINLWAWIGNLTFTRERVRQTLPRDVADLKHFIREVLGYLKAEWAPGFVYKSES